MTILSVVNEVCAVVGVRKQSSLFAPSTDARTQFEMLALANEMAQRIAWDTRDWTHLTKTAVIEGRTDEGATHPLPADYKRMLLTSNVWRSGNTLTPMRFIADADEWLRRREANYHAPVGEWTIRGNDIHISPKLFSPPDPATVSAWQNLHSYDTAGELARDVTDTTIWKVATPHTSAVSPTTFQQDRNAHSTYWTQVVKETAKFNYLSLYSIALASGGFGYEFQNDADEYFRPRMLRLGMIWQWKANKGSPYAEDMANFMTALDRVQGADKPSPIIIQRLPSWPGAGVSYPYPTPTSSDWSWPLG